MGTHRQQAHAVQQERSSVNPACERVRELRLSLLERPDMYTVWAIDKNGNKGILLPDITSKNKAEQLAENAADMFNTRTWVEKD